MIIYARVHGWVAAGDGSRASHEKKIKNKKKNIRPGQAPPHSTSRPGSFMTPFGIPLSLT